MGADLYINKVFKPTSKKYEALFQKAVKLRDSLPDGSKEEKKAQEEVTRLYDLMYSEGYFRDSYNNSDLLWQFDLSWWSDITPMLSRGKLSVTKAKALLEDMKAREPKFKKNMQDLLAGVNEKFDYETDFITKEVKHKPADMTQKERVEWVEYFEKKYKDFQQFLAEAIRLKTGIDCSL